MKTIIQIVAAIVVVIACARGGESAWRYYQFRDAVHQEVRFGNAKTTSQVRARVMELAREHEVGLDAENVVVEPRDAQTYVAVSYVEAIPLVPVIYTRNQQFDFDITVRVARPLIVDDK